MISFSAKLLVRSLLFFTTIIFAKEVSLNSSKFYVDDAQHCRISARHIERGGIGYNQGYTTFEGFFSANPHARAWKLQPFLDLKAHVFDDGKAAMNVGVGLRKIIRNRVYGFNTYYDFRKFNQLDYNQVGLGVETLGQRWDLRVNGYVPVGEKITTPYENDFLEFSGHEMILLQKYREVMTGFNAELGIHFGKNKYCDFYATAGTYYFKDREKIGTNFWGGKARLLIKFKKYWTIEFSNSYDKVFCDRFQGQLTLSIPFGGGGSCAQNTDGIQSYHSRDLLCARMVQSVDRQEIIVIEDYTQCVAAIDPATGEPYNFVFVDNTSSSEGTYESPYPTLALAQNNSKVGDILYVFAGDGTTRGMNSGITLKNNQKFWGSGIDHSIQASQGNFVIPAQSTAAPTMTNTNIDTEGNGITLAAVNEISGMNVVNVLNSGIVGADVQNVAISDCTFQGTTVFPVDITSLSQSTVTMMDNVMKNNVNGCNFIFNGTSTLSVMNNSVTGMTSVSSSPFGITASASPISTYFMNNNIANNTCGAIRYTLNNTNTAQITIHNNTINNNGSGSLGSGLGSVVVINPGSTTLGNCSLILNNNIIANNASAALYCHTSGGFNNFTATVSGNTITDNGGAGLVFANSCETFKLNANNNSILRGNDQGITTNSNIITTADITIANNIITNNAGQANGIALSHDGIDLSLSVTGNNLSSNEGSGILMYAPSGIENVTIDIERNTVNNNQNLASNAAGGAAIQQYINLSGTIKNNSFLNNTDYGLYVASTETSPSACITVTGNTTNTDYVFDAGTGTLNLAPCNITDVNVGNVNNTGVTLVQSCPGAASCA